ncbi:MAG: hypothetical protein ACTSUG_00775 [Candidatus Helarchaeota archaeon]
MAKDKIYGALILVIALIALIWYFLYAVIYGGFYGWYPTKTDAIMAMISDGWPSWLVAGITLGGLSWRWAVIGPMFIMAAVILGIAMWIGFTMLTTPPPVPLEELEELGLEEEGEEENKEEK